MACLFRPRSTSAITNTYITPLVTIISAYISPPVTIITYYITHIGAMTNIYYYLITMSILVNRTRIN